LTEEKTIVKEKINNLCNDMLGGEIDKLTKIFSKAYEEIHSDARKCVQDALKSNNKESMNKILESLSINANKVYSILMKSYSEFEKIISIECEREKNLSFCNSEQVWRDFENFFSSLEKENFNSESIVK
jgi:hypothetical protein